MFPARIEIRPHRETGHSSFPTPALNLGNTQEGTHQALLRNKAGILEIIRCFLSGIG
uniref:Uncharacterized protein n=1 Tax=Picea glauca TaxID=3330 RepID=A0A101LYP3_PICGL|nr:hypothetical protein ABT39_MTgene3594 [Picea glauca]KUM47806.1 hypothetical protein ABT39_MTgene4800 [Picea glauca]KUM47811.1 hypothetical protein ABT39_MTgene4805 [Picea glauca]